MPNRVEGARVSVEPGSSVSVIVVDRDDLRVAMTREVQQGYNTTARGKQFFGVWPDPNGAAAAIEFDFASDAVPHNTMRQPIQAFGAYITGLGTAVGQLSVEFYDGSMQSLCLQP